MEVKLKEIIAALLKTAPNHEGGFGQKSKTTAFPLFLTLVQKDVFDANDE